MSTLYRARVVRVDTTGAYVEVSELGSGVEWGPLEMSPILVAVGDSVLVGSINDIVEDLALIAPLVTDPPVAPPVGSEILFFENEAARTAAGLTLVSGLATWLDDEQRLDVYTDEGTPGWVQSYGFKANQMILPDTHKIGLGNGFPSARLDFTSALNWYPILGSNVAADSQKRWSVDADGNTQWGPGNAALDAFLKRVGAGQLRMDTYLGVGGDPVTTASVTALQSTSRVGFYSSNSETSTTHTTPHFYALESGNTDSRLISAYMSGDTNPRFYAEMSGKLWWGAGGASALDVNLYRLSANNLKTDDSLTVAGDVTVSFDLYVGDDLDITGDITGVTDVTIDNDLHVGNDMDVGDTLIVDGNIYSGPDLVNLGRGQVNRVSSTTASAAIGSTETVVMTFPSMTYRANRSYRVFHEANWTISAATAGYGNFQVRKTNASGTVLVTYSRFRGDLTSTQFSGRASGVFTVGASDVTATIVVTCAGTASYNIVQFAQAGTPRVCSIYDVGPNTNYPDNPVLS